jgi:PHD/YefM family antitoxin component YafN of YafNO toxin-antitoxin module
MDMALLQPVTITKNDRDHVVIISAEPYASLRRSSRRARLTGTLTDAERALVAAAEVPSAEQQRRTLAAIERAVANAQPGQFRA